MKLKIRHLAYCLLFIAAAKAQPVADFTANPVSGCAPLLVNFSDQSSGNPNYWKWELGNGTISYLQNPSVTYLNPGTYHVKLTVRNANGSSTVIKNQFITVFANPVVNFSASVRSGCFPLAVQFTDSSTTADGIITEWLWDFGDGNLSTQQHPTHTYTAAGSYHVSLQVTTSNGCRKSLTRNFFIRIHEGVSASFEINRANTCTLPVAVSFVNQTTGSGSLNFLWNFGDGTTSTAANPTHTYTRSGTFQVFLKATNGYGCTDTFYLANGITLGRVTADFSVSNTACQNNLTTFRNTSSPNPISCNWSFGDSTGSTAINPVKTYGNPGSYYVKMIADFGACRDSMTRLVTVNPAPDAVFTGNDTISCKFPFASAFTNQSMGGASYQWNFGDGTSSTSLNPIHTYTGEGMFTVSLVTTDSLGCTDTMRRRNFVQIKLPIATIDSLPREGCAPFTWTFRSRLVSSEPAISYEWDFGDGTTSRLPNPTHTFDSGAYTIRLVIMTAGGCTDTVIIPNGIKVGKMPNADFYATPLNVCANVPVFFYDTTPDSVNRWFWDFGDGGTSTIRNPFHLYADTGLFSIKLIVYNNGCSDTLIREDYVHIDPPIARILSDFSCTDKYRRNFTGDRSIGADEYLWEFGDGSTSTQANPVHIYAAVGSYTVTLTVRNHRTGCESVRTKSIIIADEHADFRISDSVLCKYAPFTFTSINTGGVYVSQYQWNFGDGTSATGRTVTHSYSRSGNFTIMLIVTDSVGCKDTMTRNNAIRVNGPTANFSANVPGTCVLSDVTFNDRSASDGINPIISRYWEFGDGTTSSAGTTAITHAYSSPGNYTVSLTVTDSVGCTDMKSTRNVVQITKPVARFSSADTVTCPGRNVNFISNSSGNGLTCFWEFGDGGTATGNSPVHVYTVDGRYSVKLRVKDQYGCEDSLIRVNYVHVVTGRAQFIASDTMSNCPPLVVNFRNTSTDARSSTWDFGDGTFSQMANPSHFYDSAGIYYVTLTVRGIGGCITNYTQKIEIKGPSGRFEYTPLEGCRPLTVRFIAHTRNRDRIIWDFSDGITVNTTDSVITHTYTIPGNYVPRMIMSNRSGCQVPIQGRDTIHVHGVTPNMSFSQSVICNSGTVQFTDHSVSEDSITAYQWNFGDNTTSTEKNPSHRYTAPGTYYPTLIAMTDAGCRDTVRSSIPIRISASPIAVIHQGVNACAPAMIQLAGSNSNADTGRLSWNWNFGNGQTSTLKDPGRIQFTDAGQYAITLILTNSLGCADTASTSVTAYEIPRVDAGRDTVRCYGSPVTLHASGADTYLWSPSRGLSCTNCASPAASPDSAITYEVTGTSVHGCTAKDQVNVIVAYPFRMTASAGDTLCVGESLLMYAGGTDHYTWTPAVTQMSANYSLVRAQPQSTTTYTVTGTDKYRCFSQTMQIPVRVYPIPEVDAGEDITINSGGTADLIPRISSDVTEVIWSPTGSIFRSSYPSITVKPRETTEFLVEVSNDGGCKAKDRVTVFVICNGSNVFIPNTFSPNGDGMNDMFYVRGKGLFRIRSMKVFNRWGEIVFDRSEVTPNDSRQGWDGMFKGKALTPDVYVYTVEITCDNNGSMLLKGNVALMK